MYQSKQPMHMSKVVVFSGSMKHWDYFLKAANRENLEGNIVLLPWLHQQNLPLTDTIKDQYVRMHYQRIDMADEMLVIDPDGYIGDSTRNEIAYAAYRQLPIRYLSKERIIT